MHPDNVFLAGFAFGVLLAWFLYDDERHKRRLTVRLAECEAAVDALHLERVQAEAADA